MRICANKRFPKVTLRRYQAIPSLGANVIAHKRFRSSEKTTGSGSVQEVGFPFIKLEKPSARPYFRNQTKRPEKNGKCPIEQIICLFTRLSFSFEATEDGSVPETALSARSPSLECDCQIQSFVLPFVHANRAVLDPNARLEQTFHSFTGIHWAQVTGHGDSHPYCGPVHHFIELCLYLL
jgi:hypothetical protein